MWTGPPMRRGLAMLALLASGAAGVGARADGTATLAVADRGRIEQEEARLRSAEGYAFFIVEDKASGRFVQFASSKRGLVFDFPVIYASTMPREPVMDADCGTSPVTIAAGETAKRLRPVDEETRVTNVLSASHLHWQRVYCLHRTRAGKRAGYGMSIAGEIEEPGATPALVERIFLEAYGLARLDGLRFITDRDP